MAGGIHALQRQAKCIGRQVVYPIKELLVVSTPNAKPQRGCQQVALPVCDDCHVLVLANINAHAALLLKRHSSACVGETLAASAVAPGWLARMAGFVLHYVGPRFASFGLVGPRVN